jgi:DNA-binding transcriptional MocR family regulator
MEEYWATRTGRWRRAMQSQAAPGIAERLVTVIRADVQSGALPAGALLPRAERVADELAISAGDVTTAYSHLLAEGLIIERSDGLLCIPAHDGDPDPSVGDATQIRFEAALLRAVREAAARGLSSTEATGMFKAAMQRMQAMERHKPDDTDES